MAVLKVWVSEGSLRSTFFLVCRSFSALTMVEMQVSRCLSRIHRQLRQSVSESSCAGMDVITVFVSISSLFSVNFLHTRESNLLCMCCGDVDFRAGRYGWTKRL